MEPFLQSSIMVMMQMPIAHIQLGLNTGGAAPDNFGVFRARRSNRAAIQGKPGQRICIQIPKIDYLSGTVVAFWEYVVFFFFREMDCTDV